MLTWANREGWICTRCGSSNSPDVQRCSCQGPTWPMPYGRCPACAESGVCNCVMGAGHKVTC